MATFCQLEIWYIIIYLKIKSRYDKVALRLRRLKTNNTRLEMFGTILLSLWFFLRSILDGLIDFVFNLVLYNDSKKKRIPKVKNSLVLESATSLARKIRRKEVTAETVVSAFVERAQQVNPLLNAIVDERFDLALKEAKAVDEYLRTTTDSIEKIEREKPFLGIPFTTKESSSCEGLSLTFGLVARKGVKGKEDAEVVRLMKKAGGILLGVTNIPELNLWFESRNHLYGQTSNPYNTNRTVGGSSGGEAGIISACGSPIGIGTDIGGSVRMPAFFCGIFGHKPTADLTPMKGTTRRTGEEKDSMVAAGPMTRHHEDLIPMLKVLAEARLSSVTLDEKVDLKNLKYFYFEESNDPRVSVMNGELLMALRRVVNHFQEITENSCTKVTLPGIESGYKLWRYWMTKEAYQFDNELGNRERKVNLWEELPKLLIGKCEFTLAAIFKLIDCKLPKENKEWAEATTAKLKKTVNDLLGKDGILLCPSSPAPASYHYSSFLRPYNFAYWAIFNVLKLPATQVPVGLTSDGLPMGIQVVAGPNMDHLSLAVAKEIENAFGGWIPPFPVE
ncbi:hypothetical protein RUM44_009132 [Polyplax serrata]|uniref:Amidase domain-containing protein n=1 Tax=Polyplax serrata TaxID=468196 RepID=A0ABR1ART8_POLSC